MKIELESETKDKSIVFGVNFSGLDYSKAEELGELKFMTTGMLDLQQHRQYAKLFEAHVRDADPEIDYLMFSGSSFICAVALSVWMRLHDKCNVLVWDGLRRDYNLYKV
jgi:hypothetical protein